MVGVEGAVVVVVGEGLLVGPCGPWPLWSAGVSAGPDGLEETVTAGVVDDRAGETCADEVVNEAVGVLTTTGGVIAVLSATVVPASPRLVVEADASRLTNAARTLDATISVATFENRCLVVPNTKCRSVPLLMLSKFAEQNHATTYTFSTTTQFKSHRPIPWRNTLITWSRTAKRSTIVAGKERNRARRTTRNILLFRWTDTPPRRRQRCFRGRNARGASPADRARVLGSRWPRPDRPGVARRSERPIPGP